MNRRTLLGLLVKGGGLLAAGVVAIPSLLTALAPAFRRYDAPWQRLGRADAFPVGEIREAVVRLPRDDWTRALRARTVYVWRQAAKEFVVYSRHCTDLSCPVNWDPGSQCFFCPCHGGIFAKDGRPMAGPPSEPLYRYAVRLRDGSLEIDLSSVPPMA